MQCRSCGIELPEGAVYCPKCGAAVIHQVVPEPGIASSGTSGLTIASSSNAGEQHYPSTGYGSAPSATMLQERYEPSNTSSASPQVPPQSSPAQSKGPSTLASPGPIPLPQTGGSPSGRRGIAISKRMVLLLVGLAALIVVGSVGFMLYSNRGTTNQEKAAATVTTQTNTTITTQSTVAYQSVHGTINNWVEDLTEQNGGSADNPKTLIWLEGSPTLYLFHAKDFIGAVPDPLNGDYGVGSEVTIVYQPDKTFTIDETVPGVPTTHLQGTAYQVVQLTVFDSNGQNKVFTAQDYAP